MSDAHALDLMKFRETPALVHVRKEGRKEVYTRHGPLVNAGKSLATVVDTDYLAHGLSNTLVWWRTHVGFACVLLQTLCRPGKVEPSNESQAHFIWPSVPCYASKEMPESFS